MITFCKLKDDWMAKRLRLTPQETEWLKKHHDEYTNAELADRYGVCIDTLRRLLMKLELEYFPGAKYQHREKPSTWSRPCTTCGSTIARPINQYRCETCHDREAAIDRSEDEQERSVKVSLPKLPYGESLWAIHKRLRATDTRLILATT